MDEARTTAAVKMIANRQKALAWLTEYGAKFSGRLEDNEVAFSADLKRAGLCVGANEAASLLESYARVHIQDIVASAIQCCRNDIVMARDIITAEIAKEFVLP